MYAREEDWADVAHFAKEDGSAHLYHHPGGYWQLDYRDQDGETIDDYYDGGYTSGGADYQTELSGDVWWSTGNYLTFSYTDGTEVPLPTPETMQPTEQIEVSGHVDDYYNGIYYRLEDWNGHAHFALADRSAHLFHLDSGAGYWQLDWREQDGTQDLYDGGYGSGGDDHLAELVGTRSWSSQTDPVTFAHSFLDENGNVIDLSGVAVTDGTEYVEISNHSEDEWNGIYYRVEDWSGSPHFAKEDRSAHLFHLGGGSGYWQLDYREQDGTRDYYDGGWT